MSRDFNFDENPPNDWEECGCCGGYHPRSNHTLIPAEYLTEYDCRNDLYRWPSAASIAALKANPKHGYKHQPEAK